jgi:hypothetical protein
MRHLGKDASTADRVVEDYVDKMPFSFTGTLKKFVVILEPEKLTEEERNRLSKGLHGPLIDRARDLKPLSFPKIPSGLDSHRKAESSHH